MNRSQQARAHHACCPHSFAATVLYAQGNPKGKDSELRTVRGTVIDKDENPVETAIVYLKNVRTGDIVTHLSAGDGQFRFSGLDLNVDYEIHAEREGWSVLLALDFQFRYAQGIRPHAEAGPQEEREISPACVATPEHFRLRPPHNSQSTEIRLPQQAQSRAPICSTIPLRRDRSAALCTGSRNADPRFLREDSHGDSIHPERQTANGGRQSRTCRCCGCCGTRWA